MKVGERYMLARRGAANNKIVIDTFNPSTGEFTAHYPDIDNSSVFEGRLYVREGTLLSMIQRDAEHGYTASHVGVGPFGSTSWEGAWGDVTGKVTKDIVGKFNMTRIA